MPSDQNRVELKSDVRAGTAKDSTTDGIEYFAADVNLGEPAKTYRIIWLFEGDFLEVLGVINAYRRRRK